MNNEQLTAGLLMRRTAGMGIVDAAGKVLPDQLSSPNHTEDLARHFSVNLLGVFKLEDAAWKLRRGEASEKLSSPWQPGAAGLLPTAEQAEQLPATDWHYYWLLLAELHGCAFESMGEAFTCQVYHAPTLSNYWHFELHFHTSVGDIYLLESKQRRKMAPKIRAWLQDYVYSSPPAEVPTLRDWAESVYVNSPVS